MLFPGYYVIYWLPGTEVEAVKPSETKCTFVLLRFYYAFFSFFYLSTSKMCYLMVVIYWLSQLCRVFKMKFNPGFNDHFEYSVCKSKRGVVRSPIDPLLPHLSSCGHRQSNKQQQLTEPQPKSERVGKRHPLCEQRTFHVFIYVHFSILHIIVTHMLLYVGLLFDVRCSVYKSRLYNQGKNWQVRCSTKNDTVSLWRVYWCTTTPHLLVWDDTECVGPSMWRCKRSQSGQGEGVVENVWMKTQ